MTKRDFETFIKQSLKNLPLEEQVKLLYKISHSWLPDINQKLNCRIKKSYIKCCKCGKYSLKRCFRIHKEEIIKYGVTVFRDPCYGDYDEIADVTYGVNYYVCPICGGMTLKDSYGIKEENRRPRY